MSLTPLLLLLAAAAPQEPSVPDLQARLLREYRELRLQPASARPTPSVVEHLAPGRHAPQEGFLGGGRNAFEVLFDPTKAPGFQEVLGDGRPVLPGRPLEELDRGGPGRAGLGPGGFGTLPRRPLSRTLAQDPSFWQLLPGAGR